MKNIDKKIEQINLFKTVNYWLCDGIPNSELKHKELILKSTSPISHLYLISIFQKHAKMNYYLNSWLNNFSLMYIDKEELLNFLKEIAIKNKVSTRDLCFVKLYKETASKEEVNLRKKFPWLKADDINLLSDLVKGDKNLKETISSGEIKKRKRRKKNNNEKPKSNKYSLEKLLQNFQIERYS